jgi:DNA adenine methylase
MKYLGGKYMLGKDISTVLLDISKEHNLDGYMEPFCGALGVMKRMTPYFKKCYASDIHPDLILLWKDVKNNNFKPPKKCNEKDYNRIKKLPSPNALKAFIGFGCSFGGKYFSGYAQKYTGTKNENFLQAVTNSIYKLQPVIQNVEFKCISYTLLKPKKKLIYCDPPYKSQQFPVKYRNNIKKYDIFDNNEFWNIMRLWSKDNLVIISELEAPDDFIIIFEKKKYRSISQSNKTRYKSKTTEKYSNEKLFIHNSYFD